jgi:hypothetical protein
MPRKSSPDTLVVRGLSADDQAWLASESERLGVDPENLVRAMIRQRRGLRVVPAEDETLPTTLMSAELASEADYHRSLAVAERLSRQPRLESDDAADGIVSPDEQSLDEVMAARPLFAQHRPEGPHNSQGSPWTGSPRQHRVVPPRPAPQRAVAPPQVSGAFSAFTLIQPLGLSERTVRGTMQGDGAGNVMRQNNTWAGFSSGGSRRG